MFSQRARFSLAKANGLLKRTERQVLQVRDFERFFFAIITGAFYRWSGINLNLVDTLFRVAAFRLRTDTDRSIGILVSQGKEMFEFHNNLSPVHRHVQYNKKYQSEYACSLFRVHSFRNRVHSNDKVIVKANS